MRGMLIVGGARGATIERVVRALPTLEAAVIISCAIDDAALATLQRASRMPLCQARDGAALTPGQVFVVPSHDEVRIRDGHLHITPADRGAEPPDITSKNNNIINPGAGAAINPGAGAAINPGAGAAGATDRLVRSLADGHGREAIVVVIPGADGGLDGGLARVQEVGGLVLTLPELPPHEGASPHAQRLDLALRAAPLVAFDQDTALRCTWGHMLGRDLPAAGQTDDDLFGPVEAERLAHVKRAVLATGAAARLEVPLRVDGVVHTFDLRIEPIRDTHGAIIGVRSIGLDLTPRKAAEAAQRDVDARKDQFLATISHELRAPLAPLRASLDVQRLASHDPARVARARAIMERQLDHLVRLVDDLLDVSCITEQQIHLDRRPLEVGDIFRAAVASVKPMADHVGHTLVVSPPAGTVTVVGDLTRLTQIIVNLLTNAIKYTPHGGRIELSASHDAPTRHVTITVRDNGIGIAPELLPRVFDLFVQGDDVAARSSGGLGIGLNLVRRLVELHGGTVSAHSDGVGCGAELRVVLPAASSHA